MNLWAGIKFRFIQFWLWLDQGGNVAMGGYADETMSSHLHRLHLDGKPWGWLRNPLNWFCRLVLKQEDHCKLAYERELERWHMPPEMRVLRSD